MSERLYNKAANALMLIGIASALLFDSGKLPHAVVGTIGIVAGVLAMILYFWNQHCSPAKEEPVQTEAQHGSEIKAEVLPVQRELHISEKALVELSALQSSRVWKKNAVVGWPFALDVKFPVDAIEAYRRAAAQSWLTHYAANHARSLRWHIPKDATLALMQPEVELSPNEVAACAIEIMRNLAIADEFNQWEYALGPKGLRVSMKNAHAFRPVVSQEDFDFETSDRIG
jgi:hypothetical protein